MTALRVLRAGPRTTLQDGGRDMLAHLGVPRAGAVDRRAMHQVNSAVGNSPTATVLESTLGGDELEADADMVVGVGGAAAEQVVRLRMGERLRIPRAEGGVYVYVAVAGGFDVAPVLGSRSRDTLSGLGPAPLQPGDVLTVGALSAPPPDVAPMRDDAVGERVPVFSGPHLGLVGRQLFAEFLSAQWTVTPAADRVAIRLSGPRLRPQVDGIDSEGVVPGAVQLPPDGQPVVLLANHPPTGGYPLIAVVAFAALPAVAQSRPGARLRFVEAAQPRYR
ncbi:MAG TPA: biotin-dependent carboxyltransferase family protein [Mycobacteriales bacterium]|nr:biotin-dependent carboxyltransferase family protein [Mycobacteriales bacterium]